MDNKKYIFSGLYIELTRACNKKCAHCARGAAQNITMSETIIDRIIDNVTECLKVYITGGEPLLEMDRLLYLISKISEHWFVLNLSITTNGSVLDSRIIDALEAFCMTSKIRTVCFMISHDQYHSGSEEEYSRAYSFYKELIDQANANLGDSEKQRIQLASQDLGDRILIYAGNAKSIVDQNREKYKLGKNLQLPDSSYHRLKIKDGIVHCIVYITAKGDVVAPAEDDSYEVYDKIAIGNIMQNPLSDILDRHNNSCLLLCTESKTIDMEMQRRLSVDELSFVESLRIRVFAELVNRILDIRYSMQKKYPLLTAQDIIIAIPLPKSDNESNTYLQLLYDASPYSKSGQVQALIDALGTELVDEYVSATASMSEDESAQCMLALSALAFLHDPSSSVFLAKKSIRPKNQAVGYEIKVIRHGWHKR